MNEKIIVVAPHPDDEMLGCGGTLLRLKSEGVKIAWIIVTAMNKDCGFSEDAIKIREAEIKQVNKLVDFDNLYMMNYPATRLEQIPTNELISSFSSIFKEFEPNQVFIPHQGDTHSDHRIVFHAVAACTKWFRYPSINKVLSYETSSETQFGLIRENYFRPNTFIDITSHLDEKIKILKHYKSEIQEHPFPRSEETIKALARWRGANAGFHYAEAFEVLFEKQ